MQLLNGTIGLPQRKSVLTLDLRHQLGHCVSMSSPLEVGLVMHREGLANRSLRAFVCAFSRKNSALKSRKAALVAILDRGVTSRAGTRLHKYS